MMRKKNLSVIALIVFSLFLRLGNITSPFFSLEEARIAYRGYSLAIYSKDELGRSTPIVFNSLTDYQLPVVSYLTMVGTRIFGKTDLGARIPFVIVGTLLVLLTFFVSKTFNENFYFRLMAAFIVATSPALIFLSKVPNESIVLALLLALLFYLIVNNKSLWIITFVMVLASLVSKLSWFILPLFLLFSIYWSRFKLKHKRSLYLFFASLVITICAMSIFLKVPQSQRSLIENNFPLFSDSTIRNGIDRLRGQGMEEKWPTLVGKLLFNKSHFLTVGFLHWLSHFNPSIYFGQFDASLKIGYSYLGSWVKFLLIPFVLGVIVILKKDDIRLKTIFILPLIVTYPTFFVYPNINIEAITLILPFMAMVIAFGFSYILKFNKKLALLGILLIVFELAINIYNTSLEYKFKNSTRPFWIQNPVLEITKLSQSNKAAISDNIISDITPFIYWYTSYDLINKSTEIIDFPYKFRQSKVGDIAIIGAENNFYKCGLDEPTFILASKRDLEKVKRWLNLTNEEAVEKEYKDTLNQNSAYLLKSTICVQ